MEAFIADCKAAIELTFTTLALVLAVTVTATAVLEVSLIPEKTRET